MTTMVRSSHGVVFIHHMHTITVTAYGEPLTVWVMNMISIFSPHLSANPRNPPMRQSCLGHDHVPANTNTTVRHPMSHNSAPDGLRRPRIALHRIGAMLTNHARAARMNKGCVEDTGGYCAQPARFTTFVSTGLFGTMSVSADSFARDVLHLPIVFVTTQDREHPIFCENLAISMIRSIL